MPCHSTSLHFKFLHYCEQIASRKVPSSLPPTFCHLSPSLLRYISSAKRGGKGKRREERGTLGRRKKRKERGENFLASPKKREFFVGGNSPKKVLKESRDALLSIYWYLLANSILWDKVSCPSLPEKSERQITPPKKAFVRSSTNAKKGKEHLFVSTPSIYQTPEERKSHIDTETRGGETKKQQSCPCYTV